jgi:ribonucleoside-diphosphate reductase alpha subunit
MRVLKRNSEYQDVSFDKVSHRIRKLSEGLKSIDPIVVAQKICSQIYDGVKTSELDELTARFCASKATDNIEYGTLASRIIISNNHKNTSPSFSETITMLYNRKDTNGKIVPLINDKVYDIVLKNKNKLNDVIDYERDYNFDFFGFKTLEKAYLLKLDGKVVERVQHLIMRVSIGLHGEDLKSAIESYNYMSQKFFTHASPTLFNAGTPKPQLLSCFLIGTEDSIAGIYKTISDCAKISKWAGGIGLHVSNIRGKGALIRGTNGKSTGIIPMLKVYNETLKYVNQGGRRAGSAAIYLEPHHPDIMAFLELRKNHGNEEDRARDLFLALWASDLFMKRVKSNGKWSLFDPDTCPDLTELYGDEFEAKYIEYEEQKKYVKQIMARDVWKSVINSQIETGTPYVLYKDHINKKSNQKNVGVIKSSNLCAEITEFSNDEEYACCCLASIGLSKFVKYDYPQGDIKVYTKSGCKYCKSLKNLLYTRGIEYTEINLDNDDERKAFYDETNSRLKLEGDRAIKSVPQVFVNGVLMGGYNSFKQLIKPYIDYELLESVVGVIVKNLNKIIDLNFYPVIETKRSNERHRPLGIGVQGVADLLALMRVPFESEEAFDINKRVFETIYYSACKASCELAKTDGAYSTFKGSPLSNGQFQFDLWGVKPIEDRYNWDELRADIMKHGVRNSLLTALMPTASTSQILGNNEAFEPYTSNIYVRRTIAGDFTVINKHLIRDLNELGLWSNDMKNELIRHNGSVQYIESIPDDIKKLYKTVWEIKQKTIIDLAANRGPYICQTQSMNLHFEEPNYKILNSALFYGWSKGLKTSCYYIRSRPKVQANQFTVKINKNKNKVDDVKIKEENEVDKDNNQEIDSKHNEENKNVNNVESSNDKEEDDDDLKLEIIDDPSCLMCSG